jgi:CDP-diacylglycerol--glycerol-3-phosphate 3-phosphatidyltransferase
MSGSNNLPNVITVGRIAACPAIVLLALSPSVGARFAAFVLFLVAALSDVWDGYLARKHGWITTVGKLLDPFADKLLLVSTFIPFYYISHRGGEEWLIPWWGMLPMWVLIVILGRELLVTIFRQWAVGQDVVIAAGKSGKYKALVQNLFSGGLLLWYPLHEMATARGWANLPYRAFVQIHTVWIGLTLGLALVLTIYSMVDYLWSYRGLMGFRD